MKINWNLKIILSIFHIITLKREGDKLLKYSRVELESKLFVENWFSRTVMDGQTFSGADQKKKEKKLGEPI